MSKQLFENADIQDIEAVEIVRNPFFDRDDYKADGFLLTSLLLSNGFRVNSSVWWAYKWSYLLFLFPVLFASALAVDLALLLLKTVFSWIKELGNALISWVAPTLSGFGKILGIAIALILVFEFLSHQGLDGLANLYETLCDFLKSCFNA